MKTRITEKDLEALVARLNEMTDSPLPRTIGHYYVESAYGGNQLVRIINASGGITVVLSTGFVSKRELYMAITILITGIAFGKGSK